MKHIIISISVALSLFGVNHQIQAQINYGTGFYYHQHCNFIDPCELVILDTANTNIWQMGLTDKPFFLSACGCSVPMGLMTDTTNPYPINCNSSFILPISGDLLNHGNIVLTIGHRYETDTLLDGGNIEISYDNGENWLGVYSNNHDYTFLHEFLYDETNVLHDNSSGFSGTSPPNVTSRIQIIWDDHQPNPYPGDTIIFRFNFTSDPIDNPKDGWYIDYFELSHAMIYNNTSNENGLQNQPIAIFSSPTHENIKIKLLSPEKITRIRLINMGGQIVVDQKGNNQPEYIIQTYGLLPGVYILNVQTEDNSFITKVIK